MCEVIMSDGHKKVQRFGELFDSSLHICFAFWLNHLPRFWKILFSNSEVSFDKNGVIQSSKIDRGDLHINVVFSRWVIKYVNMNIPLAFDSGS